KTNGCYGCHALGTKAMRTIPKELGDFPSSVDAWQRRIQSGQALTQMTTNLGRMGNARALRLFAHWTDRIAAGELPTSRPTRPGGSANLRTAVEDGEPGVLRAGPRSGHRGGGAARQPRLQPGGLGGPRREADAR